MINRNNFAQDTLNLSQSSIDKQYISNIVVSNVQTINFLQFVELCKSNLRFLRIIASIVRIIANNQCFLGKEIAMI